MSTQPKALQLADAIDYPDVSFGIEAATELRRLHLHEVALIEWLEKTHWVQDGAAPMELGMHRADVLKQRVDHLSALNADLLDALRRVMRHIPADAGGASLGDDMHRARAAIAKAAGGQQ